MTETTDMNMETKISDPSNQVSDDAHTDDDNLTEAKGPMTLESLGAQMIIMGETLLSINTNLSRLNSSVHNLEVARSELKDDITKLRSDMGEDLVATKTSFDDKLVALESKIQKDHIIRFSEIIADVDAQKLEFYTKIEEIKATPAHDLAAVNNMKETCTQHSLEIQELKAELIIRDKKMDLLQAMLLTHIKDTETNFNRVDNYADETRELLNQLEAHERRWAIRLFGLPAPKNKP